MHFCSDFVEREASAIEVVSVSSSNEPSPRELRSYAARRRIVGVLVASIFDIGLQGTPRSMGWFVGRLCRLRFLCDQRVSEFAQCAAVAFVGAISHQPDVSDLSGLDRLCRFVRRDGRFRHNLVVQRVYCSPGFGI